jgi:hypothetical protein
MGKVLSKNIKQMRFVRVFEAVFLCLPSLAPKSVAKTDFRFGANGDT